MRVEMVLWVFHAFIGVVVLETDEVGQVAGCPCPSQEICKVGYSAYPIGLSLANEIACRGTPSPDEAWRHNLKAWKTCALDIPSRAIASKVRTVNVSTVGPKITVQWDRVISMLLGRQPLYAYIGRMRTLRVPSKQTIHH